MATPRATINPPKVTGPPKGVVRPPTPVPAKGVLRPGSTGYVAPPAPTATGVAAAGAAPQQLPVDPIYQSALAALGKTRDDTISGLQTARSTQLLGYGYTEDPTSHALSFDPNNPFSKASLLKQQYDINRRKTAQTMGSQGQLYAGASQNAQDYLNRGQLQAEDALQKSLAQWLGQNTADVTTARNAYETGATTALGESKDRLAALENPLYTPSKTNKTPAKKKKK
jgi:hypothetical protein